MDTDEMFRLDDKVIVLTGASGLLGREAVSGLAASGAQVIAGARDSSRFEEQLKEMPLSSYRKKPICYTLDISKESSIKEFFRQVSTDFGQIDGLVNNAFPRTDDWGKSFEDINAKSLYKNLCDHAGGYFLCCQEAASYMKKQNRGVMVNMGSIYGSVGPHFSIYEDTDMTCPAAYSLIKGGIHTFSKYLATYLAPHNIRVNCLSPGGIRDDSHQAHGFSENYKKQTPMNRMGASEDVVGPLIFLLSEASRYITGQVLMVDGGWTAW